MTCVANRDTEVWPNSQKISGLTAKLSLLMVNHPAADALPPTQALK